MIRKFVKKFLVPKNASSPESADATASDGLASSASHGHAPAPTAAPERELTFDELGLHADLLRGIKDQGFERPTPIQAKAIPPILQGRNVIGLAQTGTGKTAAFVLPILHRLLEGAPSKNMRALIVAPTRELALQSMEHLRNLSKYVPLKGAAIFGGVPMDPQTSALARGVDIVSATPGRLLDHVYQGHIDFANLQIFVLDEVDRMLDMGFLPDIQRIIRLLPPERQNLVFSATLPSEIAPIVHEILKDAVTISIGRRSAPAAGVRHAIYPVPKPQKIALLLRLLKQEGLDTVLIFTRTKHFADKLAIKLQQANFKISVIHGDRSQSQRMRALEQFKRGKTPILVATDIAARGIDISDVTHVINFDVPNSPEDYVHRIGRTARAENTGDAFTLVEPQDEQMISEIERIIGKPIERIVLPDFDYGPAGTPSTTGGGRSHGGHGQSRGGGHGGRDRGGHARVQSHGGRSGAPSHVPSHGAGQGHGSHGAQTSAGQGAGQSQARRRRRGGRGRGGGQGGGSSTSGPAPR
jgi:ATP-dependent RNA helicase RhlE